MLNKRIKHLMVLITGLISLIQKTINEKANILSQTALSDAHSVISDLIWSHQNLSTMMNRLAGLECPKSEDKTCNDVMVLGPKPKPMFAKQVALEESTNRETVQKIKDKLQKNGFFGPNLAD